MTMKGGCFLPSAHVGLAVLFCFKERLTVSELSTLPLGWKTVGHLI